MTNSASAKNNEHLDRSLGPYMLWGLGVGYVISGMYFGWNLGLPAGGTLGLGIATLFIILMYVTFTFCYTEMACAIPKAGGGFDYANKALGPNAGFIAGIAQVIEFVFAPPAIAFAIGAYFHEFFPGIPITVIAGVAFLLFTGINIRGVKLAASFELLVTVFAVFELLVFAGVTLPSFQTANLTRNALPNGVLGIFAAIPFAIWFFLGIEGVANVAEETIDPQRNILKGFGSALATLVFLCVLVFVSAVGVNGWEAVVYAAPGAAASDSPLPLALGHLLGKENFLYHMLLSIGLLGLVASFHGIILAAGRATFELGRVEYFPKILGRTHPRFKTPANALFVNMLVGILALLTGKTGEIIVIACFGALVLYAVSMLSFLALRRNFPELARPFRAPLYPLFPLTALAIALVSLVAMSVLNPALAIIFFGLLAVAFGYFRLFVAGKA